MLHSISWMVTRDPQAHSERLISVLLGWFLAGGLAGGALTGAVIAFPAWALYQAAGSHVGIFLLVAAALAGVYLGKAANLWPAPKLQFRHQVPEAWRNLFSPKAAAFLYAGGLGSIFFTRLASFTAYPFAVLLIGIGARPAALIGLMAVAGLTRAGTALIMPIAGFHRSSADAVPQWMEKYSRTVKYLEITVLLCVFLVAASSIGTGHLW